MIKTINIDEAIELVPAIGATAPIDRVSAKEVIKRTNIEKVSLIRGLINNLLINLEKLRLDAFRNNNIINQYIFYHPFDESFPLKL